DFYDLNMMVNRTATLQRLLGITGQLIVLYLVVFFVSDRDALPRLFILYYGIISFVLIGLWRLANPALIGWASQARHVLVVGTGQSAQEIIRAIQQQAETSYDLRGAIGAVDEVGTTVSDVSVVGSG